MYLAQLYWSGRDGVPLNFVSSHCPAWFHANELNGLVNTSQPPLKSVDCRLHNAHGRKLTAERGVRQVEGTREDRGR